MNWKCLNGTKLGDVSEKGNGEWVEKGNGEWVDVMPEKGTGEWNQ